MDITLALCLLTLSAFAYERLQGPANVLRVSPVSPGFS